MDHSILYILTDTGNQWLHGSQWQVRQGRVEDGQTHDVCLNEYLTISTIYLAIDYIIMNILLSYSVMGPKKLVNRHNGIVWPFPV